MVSLPEQQFPVAAHGNCRGWDVGKGGSAMQSKLTIDLIACQVRRVVTELTVVHNIIAIKTLHKKMKCAKMQEAMLGRLRFIYLR